MKIKTRTLLGLLMIVSISLSACGATPEEDTKKPFFISVEDVKDFADTVNISKPGKISGSQEVMVTSQVSARVQEIKYQAGQIVLGGQPVIQLSDDIANYNSQVQKAKTALDNAILSYEQNKNTLNSSISSAENMLLQAEQAFQTSQDSAEQSIKQAEQTLENAGLEEGSLTTLNIEKIITDIENQINNLKEQYKLQKTALTNVLDDVLYQGDSLLGVTDNYKNINDNFSVYLGSVDISQKSTTEKLLLELYSIKNTFDELLSTNPTNNELLDTIEIFNTSYDKIDTFLTQTHILLQNSIVGTSLPQSKIDAYVGVFNGLQAASQASQGGFAAYQNMVNSLLGDIKTDITLSEEELINNLAKQQIEIALANAKIAGDSAEIMFTTTEISTQSSIFNAETALKNAKLNYDTSTQNKDSQINLLANAITQAKLNYEDTLTLYNKLSVRSPIQGTIGDVLIDQGQEVHPGTPLFNVISDKEHVIEIFVTTEEHQLIQVDQKVNIEYNKETLQGTITSISSVAGPTTLYKAQIKLENTVELIGDIATVQIPIQLEKVALPINSITALQNNKGFIYVLNSKNQPERLYVDLGQTRANKIEITSKLPVTAKIITSDISNYNPEKYQLEIK